MTKQSVYVETTIVSYLVARPSRDLLTLAHQEVTADWWNHRRILFDLFISQVVLDEITNGDFQTDLQRLQSIDGIPLVQANDTIEQLAQGLITKRVLPPKAARDALHLAFAAYHGINYLLTWNCKHLNNVEILPKIAAIVQDHGFRMPTVCTPEELMGV